MHFEITAYRHLEGIVSLTLEATSIDEARSLTAAQGLDIVSIRTGWDWRLLKRKDRPFDLLLFSQELRSLLDAGLSLIESLGALSRKEASPDKQRLIVDITRQLREGKSLSATLRTSTKAFPPLFLALISASEQTGDLSNALGRYIEYRGQMDGLRKRVVSATIYPALLVGVGGLVVLFLMTYVVPRFSRIYEDFGHQLPFMSRLLMQWGSLVQAHGMLLLFVLAVFGVLLAYAFRRGQGWQGLFRLLLAHKAFRERFHIYAVSRFYRTLGMLQQGGIPIVTALGLSRDLLGEDLQIPMERALNDIRGGVSLSEALEKNGLAPAVARDLLRVGERTGNVGDKMLRIADFYDEDISRWVEWFSRLFEPLLMLGIGLFIAVIIVLLYMPILDRKSVV